MEYTVIERANGTCSVMASDGTCEGTYAASLRTTAREKANRRIRDLTKRAAAKSTEPDAAESAPSEPIAEPSPAWTPEAADLPSVGAADTPQPTPGVYPHVSKKQYRAAWR